MSAPAPTADRVASLRAFNRFYTRRIGVLHERLLDSRFTLPECRVLWELAHQPGLSAGALAQELGLDAGYLSRLVGSLRERGFVKAQRAPADGRQTLLSLTAAGRRAFAPLDRRSHAQVAELREAQRVHETFTELGFAPRQRDNWYRLVK